MDFAALSAAHKKETALVSEFFSNNVPLQSYWISKEGELWKVSAKFDDGSCWIECGSRMKYGPMSCLLVGGYRKI